MFNIGDYVKIKDTNLKGAITRIDDKKYTICVNDKNICVDIDKIDKTCINRNVVTSSYTEYEYIPFNNEIMLRHKTKDEAIFELEQFINEAILNKVKCIKIIHGKSGGILRKAVHEYLRNNKHILEFKLGGYYDGDIGVTIAKMR